MGRGGTEQSGVKRDGTGRGREGRDGTERAPSAPAPPARLGREGPRCARPAPRTPRVPRLGGSLSATRLGRARRLPWGSGCVALVCRCSCSSHSSRPVKVSDLLSMSARAALDPPVIGIINLQAHRVPILGKGQGCSDYKNYFIQNQVQITSSSPPPALHKFLL